MKELFYCLDIQPPAGSDLRVWAEGGEYRVSRSPAGGRVMVFAEEGVRLWTMALPDPLPQNRATLDSWYRDHPAAVLTGMVVDENGQAVRVAGADEFPEQVLGDPSLSHLRSLIKASPSELDEDAPEVAREEVGRDEMPVEGGAPEESVPEVVSGDSSGVPATPGAPERPLIDLVRTIVPGARWSVALIRGEEGDEVLWSADVVPGTQGVKAVLVGDGEGVVRTVVPGDEGGLVEGAPGEDTSRILKVLSASEDPRAEAFHTQLRKSSWPEVHGALPAIEDEGDLRSGDLPAAVLGPSGEVHVRVAQILDPTAPFGVKAVRWGTPSIAEAVIVDRSDPETGEVVSGVYLPSGCDVVVEEGDASRCLRLHFDGSGQDLSSRESANVRLNGEVVPVALPTLTPEERGIPEEVAEPDHSSEERASPAAEAAPVEPLESNDSPAHAAPPVDLWGGGPLLEPSLDDLEGEPDHHDMGWSPDPRMDHGRHDQGAAEPEPQPSVDLEPSWKSGRSSKKERRAFSSPEEGTTNLKNWRHHSPRGELWVSELLNSVATEEELQEVGCAVPIKLLRKGYPLARQDREGIETALVTFRPRIDEVKVFVIAGRSYFAYVDQERGLEIVGPRGQPPRDDSVVATISEVLGVDAPDQSSGRDRRDRSFVNRSGR
jgi:hypothetical protein